MEASSVACQLKGKDTLKSSFIQKALLEVPRIFICAHIQVQAWSA